MQVNVIINHLLTIINETQPQAGCSPAARKYTGLKRSSDDIYHVVIAQLFDLPGEIV